MSDYEPGTVAVATVHGVEGVRVFRYEDVHGRTLRWDSATPVEDQVAHPDKFVTDVRPLVVLDLATDQIDVQSIVHTLRDYHTRSVGNLHVTTSWSLLADQIEAQTKTPRIPEPGQWGVVDAGTKASAAHRRTFVRDGHGWVSTQTVSPTYSWDELIDPTLIREGLS